MKFGKYQHFSDLGDFAYMLSARKEMLRRGLKNLCSKETFARELAAEPLPQVWASPPRSRSITARLWQTMIIRNRCTESPRFW